MMTTTPTPTTRDTVVTAAGVMPEPGDAVALPASPGDADELMAKLADQQIDELLQDEQAGVTARVVSDDEPLVPAAEDVTAFSEQLVAAATTELHDELAQLNVAPAAPSATIEPSPPAAIADLTDVVAAEFAVTPTEVPVTEAFTEPEPPVEVTQAAQLFAPSFQPSQPSATEPAATVEHVPAVPEVPAPAVVATDHAEVSDAEAVARELAADVAMLSTPLPGVVQHDAEVKAAQPDPLWRRMLDAVLAVPVLVLDAINLPVRPLSDRGREIVGAAGIVTLVNAAGLLVYLGVFATRH